MTSSRSRDDFTKRTVDLLCRRAAFICSNPDCRVMTIAPAASSTEKWIYIGEASHMASAAGGGPRPDASLTPEQRSSASNGIFLCRACARKIDVNDGLDFPIELLREWKAQHEAWVADNLNKSIETSAVTIDGEHSAKGVGKVTGLDISGPATIKPGTIVRAEGEGIVTGTRVENVRK